MTSAEKTALTGRLNNIGMVTPTLAEGQPHQVRDIDTITVEILEAQRAGGQAIIDIGNRLIEAKAMLNHGEWLPWLADKVGYSERTAQSFMQVARKYSNPQLVADLGMRKALALLALPESEREGFVAENNVVDMTSRELEKTIRERDEARKAAEQAQADARAAQEARRSMEESLKEANSLMNLANVEKKQTSDRVAELEKQLSELKAAPVEVAVMEVDQAKLDAARAEGEAAKAEEIAQLQTQLDKAKEAKKESDEKRKNAEASVRLLQRSLDEISKKQQNAAVMSDPIVAKFEVHFNRAQEEINSMEGCLIKARKLEDASVAAMMEKAKAALIVKMGGKSE